MTRITVVVPAYEEASRVGPAVRELVPEYDVLVVDDGSTDRTAAEAREAGADVIELPSNQGYATALRRGFRAASGEVVVTYDADGEHRSSDVERLVDPVATDRLDLVLGSRSVVPRRTEQVLDALVRLQVDVADAYTGFRALRGDLAADLELDPVATCASLVLAADRRGARIGDVEIETRQIEKPRGIAWDHGRHAVRVLHHLVRA